MLTLANFPSVSANFKCTILRYKKHSIYVNVTNLLTAVHLSYFYSSYRECFRPYCILNAVRSSADTF